MSDCLFCKIIDKTIPSTKVYENEYVYAFNDIDPQAPKHIILIPKKHFNDITCLKEEKIMSELFKAIQDIAVQEKMTEGFRVVCNTGKEGGQTVEHLHFHLLSGRDLQWPPG